MPLAQSVTIESNVKAQATSCLTRLRMVLRISVSDGSVRGMTQATFDKATHSPPRVCRSFSCHFVDKRLRMIHEVTRKASCFATHIRIALDPESPGLVYPFLRIINSDTRSRRYS